MTHNKKFIILIFVVSFLWLLINIYQIYYPSSIYIKASDFKVFHPSEMIPIDPKDLKPIDPKDIKPIDPSMIRPIKIEDDIPFLNNLVNNNKNMELFTPAFNNEGLIPKKYTCDGGDHSFPFEISGAPQKTKSFVIIMGDPDAPSGDFIHWLHWNLPATSTINYEDKRLDGVSGLNSAEKKGYKGPCPPAEHRYYFTVYALDTLLNISESSTKDELLRSMTGHLLGKAGIMGRYKR